MSTGYNFRTSTKQKSNTSKRKRGEFITDRIDLTNDNELLENHPILLNNISITTYYNDIQHGLLYRMDNSINQKNEMISINSVLHLTAFGMAYHRICQPEHIGIIGIQGMDWNQYSDNSIVKWHQVKNKSTLLIFVLHHQHHTLNILHNEKIYHILTWNSSPCNFDTAHKHVSELKQYLVKLRIIENKTIQHHIVSTPFQIYRENMCGQIAAVIGYKLIHWIQQKGNINAQSIGTFMSSSIIKNVLGPNRLKPHILQLIQSWKGPRSYFASEPPTKKSKIAVSQLNDQFSLSQSNDITTSNQKTSKKNTSKPTSLSTITNYSVYIAENQQQLAHNSCERDRIIDDIADYIEDRHLTLSQLQSVEHTLNQICNKIEIFDDKQRHRAHQLRKHTQPAADHSRSDARSPSSRRQCFKPARDSQSSTNKTSTSPSKSKSKAKSKYKIRATATKQKHHQYDSQIGQLQNEIEHLKQQKQQLTDQVQEISLVLHILLI